jgi:hypothetical protein
MISACITAWSRSLFVYLRLSLALWGPVTAVCSFIEIGLRDGIIMITLFHVSISANSIQFHLGNCHCFYGRRVRLSNCSFTMN